MKAIFTLHVPYNWLLKSFKSFSRAYDTQVDGVRAHPVITGLTGALLTGLVPSAARESLAGIAVSFFNPEIKTIYWEDAFSAWLFFDKYSAQY
jgi:hypothetical protein